MNNSKTLQGIENHSQQATCMANDACKMVVDIPSDEVLIEAAQKFWSSDHKSNKHNCKLAVDYFKHVLVQYFNLVIS